MHAFPANQITSNDQTVSNKRARLVLQLEKNNARTNPIKALNEDDPAPLSYAQERLWVMSRLQPDNPVYNVAGAMQLNGVLNTAALQQALDEVLRRHQILRSRFVTEHHAAVQRVMPGHTLDLFRMDLTHCPEGVQDAFIRRPFDLAGGPPIRGLLATTGERQHRLLLVLHHIASDRWSVGILMQEVAALYSVYSSGMPSPLPEPTVQYRGFAAWQRQRHDKLAQDLDYWRSKLDGVPPLLALPADRPRPALQSYRGDSYRIDIPEALTMAVKALGKQHNASLFMVIAAAFSILLHRYTGSRDMAIGYPSAGRNQAQITNLIGFFVNTLVLRARLQGSLSFTALLQQIRDQALNDQSHQELVLDDLIGALNLTGNTGHSPLFQVMLTVQNAPISPFHLPGLEILPIALKNATAPFDLTLLIEEHGNRLEATFEYSTDLFDAATIARMAGHLQNLLLGISFNPEMPVSQLPLLGHVEKQCLLYEWNKPCPPLLDKTAEDGQTLLIHQLFAARAESAPDKTALVCSGQRVCYGELERRSNQTAHSLRALGVGPESRVGVCAERSVEMIVGLLAALKAGAAYVPLDPGYPEERLAYIVNDAGIGHLLAQGAFADRFAGAGIAVIYLDQPDQNAASAQSSEPVCTVEQSGGQAVNHGTLSASSRPTPETGPDNTAYIIYTSGSTGRPKGVPVSHRNLLHSNQARTDYYQEPPHGFLLLSSFAFDSSVAGIFWTLTQGGCLCLPRQHELTEPFALARLIDQHRISHLLALPSFYAAIVSDRALPLLTSLKTVIVAGEACSAQLAAEHYRKLPGVALYNEYGPTEATVWSSVMPVREDEEAGGVLPIGRPIERMRIYIMDSENQPAPIGVSGELYIGGYGLAQGYLNQPALTAERFIPDPFGACGQRLYRTGDLGRYRADGVIEFLGRIDNQVKVRGYRIELGEIEACLLQNPLIAAAVVLARDDALGNKFLVAYMVAAKSACAPDTQAVQRHLRQSLPDYMVPAVLVWLDELPLTANGKLDRHALPEPGKSLPVTKASKPASSASEQALAGIWHEVLGIEVMDVTANFFELGGHSLAAIQVISRIQNMFNVDMPLESLFESPTIEALASAVDHLYLQQQDSAELEALFNELEQMSDQQARDLLDA